ncbi:TetR family transcriptional regulator (plasmid) [Deinococcus aetherius]|uniref:TetR family transcriptional regulator n=1 Tax=Deinococcus aetherius TaxID=200252 RepID=A0ABM8AIT7_9DEIO|nr:TetR/AcrR family transcriptional regulator [Deinococcus aetherius]BDP43625.1 TetR family transcriptional regulator [Deinococcus aetherius]
MPAETPRSLAKRQQILTAARTLFLTQGYARTSTDAITEAASVSKQTLYAYYRGKSELLAATIAQELGVLDLDGRFGQTPATLTELRSCLLDFSGAVTGHLLKPDALALLRLLIGEAIHLPDLRASLRQAFPARLIGATEHLLAGAHTRGLIHTPDPHLSARMFVGPVMSYVALDGLFSDTLPQPPPQATLATLVDLFLRTVAAKGEET